MSDIPHWDPSVLPTTTPHVWLVQEVNPKTLISCLIGIFTTQELAIKATRGEPCMFVAPVPLDHMASLGPDVETVWAGGTYPNNVGPDMVPNPMPMDEWKARNLGELV